MNIIQFFKNRHYRNAEMVSYWKKEDAIEAKLYKSKEGHYEMQMSGEKYPFPGHPRGTLLFGKLSPLKHQIKNQVFNESWALLEKGASNEDVLHYLKYTAWPNIFAMGATLKYDMVPFDLLNPPVKELYRAMTVSGVDSRLRDIITFILQEDDAYRMRFQWLAKFFPRWRKTTWVDFHRAMIMAEEAEIVGDMKERQRLFRRIMLLMAKDSLVFTAFLKEVDWKKVRLTKADKYFFRAKYYKVDFPEYQY